MTKEETKALAYRTLAKNRYANRPEEVTPNQWAAIRSIMERRFTAEWMDTPAGLYTDSEIWAQTFQKYLKEETFKVGDKVIYHGHEMVITDIYGKRADLRYKDVEVAGIKLTSLKKA